MERAVRTRIVILQCLFMAMFMPSILNAQSCLPNGIVFNSQAEIDLFPMAYPDCIEIEGDVLINGDYIYHLSGLSNVESIGGSLRIEGNSNLLNLSGMDNLGSIGDSLIIWENPDLINLQGLSSLETIGSWFLIYNNWNLTGLSDMTNLRDVQGTIFFGLNYNLVSTSGIDSLEYVGGDLVLFLNDALTSIIGFQSLKSIGGTLNIDRNEYLLNLEGLDSLTSIGGDLELIGNRRLNDINSLMQLKSIGGQLYFYNNTNILSLSGLDSINPETIESLVLYSNHDLMHCNIKSVCDYLNIPNSSYWIDMNAYGCFNVTQVLESCGIVSVNDYQSDQQISTSPNPFTTSTTIEYELTEPSHIQLTIYNAIGGVVYQAEDCLMPVGKHSFIWRPENLHKGMYYGVLRSEEIVSVLKMIKQ